MQWIGTGECSPRKRTASRMSSGPVEQLRPMTSTFSASSVASAALMSVPSSILPPLGRRLTLVWIGTLRPVSLNASRVPKTAALTSRMSCAVSMMIRSAPPSSRPWACSVKTVTSSRKVILPRVGSSEAGRCPVGPIEPATKRSSPTASRAISAALRLISSVWSAEAPLLELDPGGLEGVGLDDLGARLDHRLVHALDDVGAVEHERLVAAAREPVVLLEREVELLERGAHPAVEDDDVVAHGGEEVTHDREG